MTPTTILVAVDRRPIHHRKQRQRWNSASLIQSSTIIIITTCLAGVCCRVPIDGSRFPWLLSSATCKCLQCIPVHRSPRNSCADKGLRGMPPRPYSCRLRPVNWNKIRSRKYSKTNSRQRWKTWRINTRGQIYVVAAGCAEACASSCARLKCSKYRVQTLRKGRSAHSLGPALLRDFANRQNLRFPFGSLVPLWGQVPSTIANFIVLSVWWNSFTRAF
jgi:hypothetical protein